LAIYIDIIPPRKHFHLLLLFCGIIRQEGAIMKEVASIKRKRVCKFRHCKRIL